MNWATGQWPRPSTRLLSAAYEAERSTVAQLRVPPSMEPDILVLQW
jgi:hypothetical protein